MKDGLRAWLGNAVKDESAILSRGNQGLLLRYRDGGRDLIIKTPTGRGLAWQLRRATLRREYLAYRRLEGLSGLPRCHGFLDGRYLVLDYIRGQPFRDAEIPDRERLFVRLLETVLAMHQRGVAHGDLKRKANLIIDESGEPVILDFGTAVCRKPGRHPLNHRLYNLMCQTDLNAWVKLKYGGYDNVPDRDLEYLRLSRMERWLRKTRSRNT